VQELLLHFRSEHYILFFKRPVNVDQACYLYVFHTVLTRLNVKGVPNGPLNL